MYTCKKCGATITQEQSEGLKLCQNCLEVEVHKGNLWFCPMGHWTEVKPIIYRGALDGLNNLSICETCGIVFDQTKVKIKNSGGFAIPRAREKSKMPWE